MVNGITHLVVSLLRFLFLGEFSVTCGKYDLVVSEDRVRFEFLCQSLCAVYTVQEPEGMFQFCTEFGRREREFLLRGQCIKETVNRLLIHKITVRLDREEQIQVKGILLGFTLYLNALLQLLTDDLGHLIGKQIKLRQVFIGIVSLRIIPAQFCFLLVGVCPVVDRIGREFVICQCLERCAGQVQGVITLDLMKRHIGLGSINALMRLINDQQFPMHIDLTGHDKRLTFQSGYLAHEAESRLCADKLDKILIPRICDSWAVRHDQDIAGVVALGRLQALAEVVGRKRFAETGFCVPEKFALFVAHKVVKGLRDRLLLLGTEFIGDCPDLIHNAFGTAKF